MLDHCGSLRDAVMASGGDTDWLAAASKTGVEQQKAAQHRCVKARAMSGDCAAGLLGIELSDAVARAAPFAIGAETLAAHDYVNDRWNIHHAYALRTEFKGMQLGSGYVSSNTIV